jgi:hypothetical protein
VWETECSQSSAPKPSQPPASSLASIAFNTKSQNISTYNNFTFIMFNAFLIWEYILKKKVLYVKFILKLWVYFQERHFNHAEIASCLK